MIHQPPVTSPVTPHEKSDCGVSTGCSREDRNAILDHDNISIEIPEWDGVGREVTEVWRMRIGTPTDSSRQRDSDWPSRSSRSRREFATLISPPIVNTGGPELRFPAEYFGYISEQVL